MRIIHSSVTPIHTSRRVSVSAVSRRNLMTATTSILASTGLLHLFPSVSSASSSTPTPTPTTASPLPITDPARLFEPGPFRVSRFPPFEHTATRIYPGCVGDKCLLRLDVYYPQGPGDPSLPRPYPLAILCPGFLVSPDAYTSYAKVRSRPPLAPSCPRPYVLLHPHPVPDLTSAHLSFLYCSTWRATATSPSWPAVARPSTK